MPLILFMADFDGNQILSIDPDGGSVRIFVPPGFGGLSRPSKLCSNGRGGLLVSSAGSNEILIYDTLLGSTRPPSSPFVPSFSGGLNLPTGIVVGPDGYLYVASLATSQVLRYNGVTGEFRDVFVSAGSGGLLNPEDITFGPDGNLYVCPDDTAHPYVLRYQGPTGASPGAFLDLFARIPLTAEGRVALPNVARFSPLDGHLYVTCTDSTVKRFNGITGAFIDNFVPAGSGGLFDAQGFEIWGDSSGNLILSVANLSAVLNYNANSGAFQGNLFPPGSDGLVYCVDVISAYVNYV